MQYVTHGLAPQIVEEGAEVIFSYDVLYKQSDIRWASRWDTYLLMVDDQIHWFSIINSMMIVLFLSGMVALIMLRTLHRDISRYNQLETSEEASREERVEVGARRRVSNAPGEWVVSGARGDWGSNFSVHVCHAGFCDSWIFVPANRGGLGADGVAIHVYGFFERVRVWGIFQDF